eukprot:evm.model.NODE_29489_length_5304_cov_13.813160.2
MASSHSVFKDLLMYAAQLAPRHNTPSSVQTRPSSGVSAPSGIMHPASSLSTTESEARHSSHHPHQHFVLAPAAAGEIPSNLTHPPYPYPGHPSWGNADEFNATAPRTTFRSAHQPWHAAAHVNVQAQGPTDSKDGSQSLPPQQPFYLQQHIYRSDVLQQHQQHQHQHQQQHQQQDQHQQDQQDQHQQEQ